ncbi:hypothetical protein YQE_03987, partial [Dendroctonus ponderosae]
MVTVLETPIQQKDTPERSSTAEEGRKSPTRPDVEEKPKIRLRLGLATDPAHNLLGPIKSELDAASQPTAEYLATLPPAIQSALASRGLLFPAGLNLNEAVVAMAAAQRAAASTEAVRAASVESVSASETSRTSVPIYQCVPCGIRFSSLSTLEAHQTYYCSHSRRAAVICFIVAPNKPSEDDPKTSGASSETVTGQSDADSGDPSGKALRTSKQYTCMHCSYSADKKVSLNRHMRMHTVSPGPATAPASSAAPLPNGELSGAEVQDRYCAECDIRFSSQKTYRAHKMHYCNSRHVIKPTAAPSSCTSSSSPTSPADPSACRTPPSPAPQQQPFLALPTNPIIIVPYALFRSASVLPTLSTPNGVPSPDTPCFLLPNGTLQPMTSALSSVNLPTQAEVLKAANKSNKEPTATRETSSGPLDLTMRKSPEMKKDGDEADYDHEKENMKSPEKIECEPSIQSSPCSTHSPGLSSPKRKCEDASRSNSPRASKTPKLCLEKSSRSTPEGGLAAHFDAPPVLHPLLLRSGNISSLFPPELQMRLSDLAPLPPVMPQVIVKQGVSKCKECNIVFCKHENYLVHKKHYCFARPTEDDASKTSGSPPVSPRSGGTTSPAAQYQQLICLACGIKFTSPDNLNAHQQYYCLKRNETEREPKRCGKCRGILEPGHQCVAHSAVAGWKCPCCDIISATASAAQRHMETHTGVKAYRCTICKYKGNTLRGMKTHIRMHFDKRSPDLQQCLLIKVKKEAMEPEVIIDAADGATIKEEPETSTTPKISKTLDEEIMQEVTKPGAHYCKSCDISFNYPTSFIAHKKFYCQSHAGEISSANNNNNTAPRTAETSVL